MNFSEEKDSLSHCFNDDTVYVERILKKVVSYSLNSYFNEEGMQMTLTTLRKNRLINLYKTICIFLKEELHNLMKVTKILLRFYIIRGSSKSRITKNLTNWMKTNMWYVNIKHQNIKHRRKVYVLFYSWTMNKLCEKENVVIGNTNNGAESSRFGFCNDPRAFYENAAHIVNFYLFKYHFDKKKF